MTDEYVTNAVQESASADKGGLIDRTVKVGGLLLAVDRRLGEGATSTIWLAHDTRGTTVALKVLTPAANGATVLRERFLRECDLLMHLAHPGIVRGLASGEVDGLPCLAMEYIEGRSLFELLRDRPLDIGEALDIAADVAFALNHLYFDGRISAHRDIKPGNIVVTSGGHAKLIDFGVARCPLHAIHDLDTHFLGTIQYMAPEQIDDAARADIRSDIYSLGAVFYEMCTGQHAFTGTERHKVLATHLNGDIPKLSRTGPFRHNAALYRACTEILRKTLDADPSGRVQTPAELLALIATAKAALPESSGIRETLHELAVAAELIGVAMLCTFGVIVAFKLFG